MKIYDWTLPNYDELLNKTINPDPNGLKKCFCINGMIPVYGGKLYPCPYCSPKFKGKI